MSVFDSVLVRGRQQDDPHLTNQFLRFANQKLNIRARTLDDVLPVLFKDPPSSYFLKKQRVSTLLTLSLLVSLQPHFFHQGYTHHDLQQLQGLLLSMGDAEEAEEIGEPKQPCSRELTAYLKRLNNAQDDQHLRRKDRLDEYEQKIRKLELQVEELKRQATNDILLNEEGNISSFSIVDIEMDDVKDQPRQWPRISVMANVVLGFVVVGLAIFNFT